MKKILLSVFILCFSFTKAFASGDIDVLPTMYSKSSVQDKVWVGTFQIVWNDLMDRIVHLPIRFPEGTTQIAHELNQQTFTVDDLSENCYYQYAGRVKRSTKDKIIKAIAKKFNEKSDILDKMDLTPSKRKLLVYAMLKKDFNFLREFDKLGTSKFGEGQNAEYFGINQNSNDDLRKGVKVLFYNNPYDYAVMLDTEGKDEVYLYKTETTKPFIYVYADMLKKQEFFSGDSEFNKNDALKVPNLKFFEEKSFDELTNKRIKGTQITIDKALETVKFEMNNKGVELKSEAAIMMTMTSLGPNPMLNPRYFYFNDTFVLFLKEKGKNQPYFALRVHNISKFQ